MKMASSQWVCGTALLSLSLAAVAGETKPQPQSPQEPAGFITGAVIGGFAGGPFGAVIGAGLGTWLGNRVHRADQAATAESQVVALRSDNERLQTDKVALLRDKSDLSQSNAALAARFDDLSRSAAAPSSVPDEVARQDAARALNGLQGDILFRTGSAQITPEMAQGVTVLAEAVAKSPALKVRVDGYADPRGTDDTNLKLSQQRANAVRDLFLAAGVAEKDLSINAYGKSQSTAQDNDGYALERRVRLTLQAEEPESVAQNQ